MRIIFCLAALLPVLPVAANDFRPRPTIVPLPEATAEVSRPVIDLGGTWKFTLNPPASFWENTANPASWSDVTVPGEPWMQGHFIERDVEYPYKRRVDIPADYAGQRVFLRFDGVYSTGRVWVDGQFAGEHYGGFTSWDLDITGLVTPGASAWLTVAVEDKTDDPSFASGYASRRLGVNDFPHHIGGILRDVTLFAVPVTHLTRLHVETDLDENYENADLKILAEVANAGPEEVTATIRYTLLEGDQTVLSSNTALLTVAAGETKIGNLQSAIGHPALWDAEHPHLYTLRAKLVVNGVVAQVFSKQIGFREVEIDGNRFLVNGREVKLRGGCRHSVHPLAGRAYLPGLAEQDVVLYKQANINYIRTSHYPATERFLELCDQYGIYVEEEMAICWIDHGAAKGRLNGLAHDPAALPYFMTAISETLERDRSHPSIVIWSLGNENTKWGPNFETERDYARLEDPTRPLKTGHNHYGGWNTDEYLDIDSRHYPGWNSSFDKEGKPYLFDEYCHVFTYYELDSVGERDPNGRNFWGESLNIFWEKMFPSRGTMGAAIWGTIDEVFLAPDRSVGYGRWGIFDGWRRPKPEYWLTRKAYSPVRIANAPLGNPGPGNPLRIPVKNWFDHTNFNELGVRWEVESESGRVTLDLAPHAEGELELPARDWKPDDVVRLTFTAQQPGFEYCVDEFLLPLEPREVAFPPPSGPCPALAETADKITVTGERFEVVFDKHAGVIRSGIFEGEEILAGGPVLNLTPYPLSAWVVSSISAVTNEDAVVVSIAGAHGALSVNYILRIDGNGLIETTYSITNPPTKADTYDEVGVAFTLPEGVDVLEWDRKGLWSVYPADHIGRNCGRAPMVRTGPEWVYREEPTWPWAHDMKDFHHRGKDHEGYGMTHDFRGAKEYVHYADAVVSSSGTRLRIESDGASHAVRMQFDKRPSTRVDDRDDRVTYSGAWTPFSDAGNHLGTEMHSNETGAYAEYRFSGTSVRFIGARNHNLGKVDVVLDGVPVAEGVDAYAASKQHQQELFSVGGLEDTQHVLKVVVRGDKNPRSSNTYALIDAFADVPPEGQPRGLCVNINRQWAYPLGWGNYTRTSSITSGFTDTVRVRLTNEERLRLDESR